MLINVTEIPTYFINLDQHTEKRESTEAVLSELGFKNVKRVPGVFDSNSRLGCTLAHKKALETALDETDGPFLILEDDIKIRNRITTYDIPDSTDALYLGISRWGIYNGKGFRQISIERHSEDIYRLYNMLSGHAILYINREYAKLLVQAYQFYVDTVDVQDKGNAELMKYFEVYGLTNPIFYQEGINEKETNFLLPGPRAVGKFEALLLK